MGWADDPELLATFTTEVGERLMSLRTGLLSFDDGAPSRAVVDGLFRDAHTIKGSARMLGLDQVVALAHRSEDLLGAVRDGRVTATPVAVDVLLRACEAIERSMPGAASPVPAEDCAAVAASLEDLVAGRSTTVPALSDEVAPDDEDDSVALRSPDHVRVRAARLYEVLDLTGEAELEVRRIGRSVDRTCTALQQHGDALAAVRRAAARHRLPAEVADAVHGLIALEDQLLAGARDLATGVADAQGRLEHVRASAMGLAMVPLGRVTGGFAALARNVARSAGKDVRLVIRGDDVELDARVLDSVADALQHLVTNAVDHGCEAPADRVAAGKPGRATVELTAQVSGSTVVIEVSDDGAGVDEARIRDLALARGLIAPDAAAPAGSVLPLLFVPGFTTRDDVTSTSGRGVGLDVVRTAVESLGGTVEIESEPGRGTRFVLTVPVTLGVMRCLVARVGDESYALPIGSVVETVSLAPGAVASVAGAPVLVQGEESVPLADLGEALGVTGARQPAAAVVVRYGGTGDLLAWAVDALDREDELIVKDLGGFLGRPHGLAGATIDGDGAVMLLLDLRELAAARIGSSVPTTLPVTAPSAVPSGRRPTVLVVEDSIGVRELERVILEGAGYEVVTAVDGLDGAARLSREPVDAVVSDVEMPGMDGFTLTRTIRRTRGWEDVPVVIMTSRGDDADRRAGLDAGASAYLLKSEFDQHELVETVRRLVGR